MTLLDEEEISRIGRKGFGSEQVRVLSQQVAHKSKEKVGFMGTHLTLTLEVSLRGAQARKTFFVKTYEVKPGEMDYLGESGIFQREMDFYRFVAEDMRDAIEGPEWCPKYFFSKDRVLVLEDLSDYGFKMADDMILDKAHLESVLTTLAAMHATSLAFEAGEGKTLIAMYPTVLRKDILYEEENLETLPRKWVYCQVEDLLEGIEYLEGYSDEEKNRIKQLFRAEIMKIYKLSKISQKYRNVLTHGDMWKNNFLFRYSPRNLPTECRFVDFQFIRYAPPAHDVMHLLHYVTTKTTRDREQAHFLRFYYRNLRERLKELDMEVEAEVTEEDFLVSCKEYNELALIQSLLSLHYFLGTISINRGSDSYRDDYPPAQRQQYMKKFFETASYSDRITTILQELIDDYILIK